MMPIAEYERLQSCFSAYWILCTIRFFPLQANAVQLLTQKTADVTVALSR